MRAVSAAEILNSEPNYLQSQFPALGLSVDGYVFPKPPLDVFAAGQEHRVGLLLGSNSRERVPGTTPPANLQKAIEDGYGPIAPRALAIYVGAADPLYGSPADQWATDTSFRCATVAQLAFHAAAGNPNYQFEFARVPQGHEAVGATHASELEYVFGTFGSRVLRIPVHYNAVDREVSNAMQQYWTNFAKTGDPNGENLPTWPRFDVRSRAYLQFTDAGPVAREGLRRPFCDLYMERVRRVISK